jgi:hypothetical protein
MLDSWRGKARGGEYSVPQFLKAEEDVAQGGVVCEELDLAGAVKEDVVICKMSE